MQPHFRRRSGQLTGLPRSHSLLLQRRSGLHALLPPPASIAQLKDGGAGNFRCISQAQSPCTSGASGIYAGGGHASTLHLDIARHTGYTGRPEPGPGPCPRRGPCTLARCAWPSTPSSGWAPWRLVGACRSHHDRLCACCRVCSVPCARVTVLCWVAGKARGVRPAGAPAMEKPDLGTAPIRDIVKYAVLHSKRRDGAQRKQQGKHAVRAASCWAADWRLALDDND